ncbi:hypothetical protein PIB30_108230, partial [Stylosanthes scabra]|nr:hypothetical protein [Stylosanthes scabra]
VKAQRNLQFEQEEVNSEEGTSENSFEEECIEEEIQDNMADNNQRSTLADYTNPTTTSCGSSIVWPNVDANNFELKPALVQLVQQNQFGGKLKKGSLQIKKRNLEAKQSRVPRICVEEHAYACCSYPNPRL